MKYHWFICYKCGCSDDAECKKDLVEYCGKHGDNKQTTYKVPVKPKRSDRLRDSRGQFIKKECPECGDQLVMECHADGAITWRCDGLIDPEDENKELQACKYETWSGDKP